MTGWTAFSYMSLLGMNIVGIFGNHQRTDIFVRVHSKDRAPRVRKYHRKKKPHASSNIQPFMALMASQPWEVQWGRTPFSSPSALNASHVPEASPQGAWNNSCFLHHCLRSAHEEFQSNHEGVACSFQSTFMRNQLREQETPSQTRVTDETQSMEWIDEQWFCLHQRLLKKRPHIYQRCESASPGNDLAI
jgi:hypothetical protein